MNELNLISTIHPDKDSKIKFEALIGIDSHKNALLNHLKLFFDTSVFKKWQKKYHKNGIPRAFSNQTNPSPMFILSGEVGTGKTALALSVATPLSESIGKRITTLETPSNIRGSGRVGELSNRITETFSIAKRSISEISPGILVIDEADDLATSRSQNQAHHEDRAGLNVLLKQIDLLKKENSPLAVILITNRAKVLDPAVLRRAELQLSFNRPNNKEYQLVFETLLAGTDYTVKDISNLVQIANSKTPQYSYSDLIERVGKVAFREAIFSDVPYDTNILKKVLTATEPTPLLETVLYGG